MLENFVESMQTNNQFLTGQLNREESIYQKAISTLPKLKSLNNKNSLLDLQYPLNGPAHQALLDRRLNEYYPGISFPEVRFKYLLSHDDFIYDSIGAVPKDKILREMWIISLDSIWVDQPGLASKLGLDKGAFLTQKWGQRCWP